jgi:cytidine deaminase
MVRAFVRERLMSVDLSKAEAQAVGELESYLARAYARYSDFQVAAAVVDEQGRVHFGVNVENAAYPLGACAEPTAIGAMITAGGSRVLRVYVTAAKVEHITPCGGCRQRIAEFADKDCEVVVVRGGQVRSRTTIGALLPDSFALDA